MTQFKMHSLSLLTLLLLTTSLTSTAWAIGEASTSFSIYVPPNNDNNGRDVCLVVTAFNETPTTVDIIDDDADGDDDDTVLGAQLGRGQSYILYPGEGAVNDDAGGKWDGDYFKITADHPVVVQMATRSNWQHDWVPGQAKSSRDTNFFIWAPPTSGDDNDINVYAYEEDTLVEIEDITQAASTGGGPSSVSLDTGKLILRKRLARGEDLVVRHELGIDVLDPGHTYWVRSSRPVTVQYGHLGSLTGRNSVRDGGGFVPGNTGAAVSESFYFAIPHHPGAPAEKELRVVSYDDDVTFTLMGWSDAEGGFEVIEQRSLQRFEHLDYVGHHHAAFRDAELYHVVVSPPGKAVTLFEASWLETGSSGTSDYASSVSSSSGSGAGTEFVTYLGPPGYQNNWSMLPDPQNSRLSHLFIYGFEPSTVVTIKDADTNGQIVNEQITILGGAYHDFAIDLNTYDQMNEQGRRPYIHVTSTEPVAIHNTNFNDNWMAYATTPMLPDPVLSAISSTQVLGCGEAMTLDVAFGTSNSTSLNDVELRVRLPEGFDVDFNSLSSTHPDSNPTNFTTYTNLDGSTTLIFDMQTTGIAAGTMYQFSMDVTLDCDSIVGCVEEGLADVNVTLRGSDFAQDVYENRAHVAVVTERDDNNHVLDIISFFDDMNANARIGFEVGQEDGLALYEVTRASSPDSTPNTVAYLSSDGAAAGPSFYWFSDYSVVVGQTYFYRVNVTHDDGCATAYGPFSVKLEAGASSGRSGGLESNGRMADQLAIRAIERRFLSLDVTRSYALQDRALTWPERLLPDLGPLGSIAVETSPRDLELYTNAEYVAARDYVHATTGETLASVLITETRGATYEHSKGLCDRADGSSLHSLYSEPLEQLGGHVMTRYHLSDSRHDTSDYATSFKLYGVTPEREAGDDMWAIHSAWMRRDYPEVAPTQHVLNVQIWSSEPGFESWLTEQVLGRADRPLLAPEHDVKATSQLQAHEVYIKQAHTIGSRITLTLHTSRPDAHTPCELRANLVSAHTGHMDVYTQALGGETLRHGELEMTLTPEPFLDVTVELVCAGEVVDEVWLSDGTWTLFADDLWGGDSSIEESTLNGCERRDELAQGPREALDLARPLSVVKFSGCGSLQASVDDFAGLARHFGGGAAPLELNDEDRLSAYIKSTHDVKVCLYSQRTPGEHPLCHVWEAAPEGAWRTMHLGEIELDAHVTRQHFSEVYMVTFGSSQQGAQVAMEVSHLEIAHEPLPQNETPSLDIFPRPVVIELANDSNVEMKRTQKPPHTSDENEFEIKELNEVNTVTSGCQVSAQSPVQGGVPLSWPGLCFIIVCVCRRARPSRQR